jgi:hypothetical protein
LEALPPGPHPALRLLFEMRHFGRRVAAHRG